MNLTVASVLAFSCYLLATIRLVQWLYMPDRAEHLWVHTQALLFGVGGLVLHSFVLYDGLFVQDGLNMALGNVWALVGWLITLGVILTTWYRPSGSFLVLLFPFVALGLVLEIMLPGSRVLTSAMPNGLKVHVLLSIIAYSLLAISTLQAILLALQERFINSRQPLKVMHIMPPMQTMETFLFRLILVGFFVLSLSLATGAMFVHDLFAQHLIHKTFLSIIAWLVYAILLWGHWRWGWRGQWAVRWTIGGFSMLLLAYFGSKFVLETILVRVS